MKIYIFAQKTIQTICSNASFDLAMQTLSDQSASIEVIEELKIIKDAAFAFECQTSRINNYAIAQEVKSGKLLFNISKMVEKKPFRIIETGSINEAITFLESELNNGVIADSQYKIVQNEGGKRTRISTNGKVITCGKVKGFGFTDEQIANSIPVKFLLCNIYGEMIAATVE